MALNSFHHLCLLQHLGSGPFKWRFAAFITTYLDYCNTFCICLIGMYDLLRNSDAYFKYTITAPIVDIFTPTHRQLTNFQSDTCSPVGNSHCYNLEISPFLPFCPLLLFCFPLSFPFLLFTKLYFFIFMSVIITFSFILIKRQESPLFAILFFSMPALPPLFCYIYNNLHLTFFILTYLYAHLCALLSKHLTVQSEQQIQ